MTLEEKIESLGELVERAEATTDAKEFTAIYLDAVALLGEEHARGVEAILLLAPDGWKPPR